ncbi:MAG: LamG-like jellyroll fold domain-containing protein [Paludibacter sp.]
MGFFSNPKIVTNGLVFYADAANFKSYPNTATTKFFDISGNNKDGTISGPDFSTDGGGSLLFNGTGDVVAYGAANSVILPLPQFTIETCFKSPGLAPGMTLNGIIAITFGLSIDMISDGSTRFLVYDTVSAVTNSIYSTQTSFGNNWNYITVKNDGNISYIYTNSILSNSGNAQWTGTTLWPTNDFNLGRNNNSGAYFLTGNIAFVRIYNRCLLDSEILQNFNSLKGRFNL